MKKAMLLALASLALVGCQQEAEKESSYEVQYIGGQENAEKSKKDADQNSDSIDNLETEEKTIDQINAEEGIAAEQIVVKITDKGYVTTHGNHFHAYNGKVPFDALIGERLFVEDGETISEHEAGRVVLVDGEYGFVVEDKNSPLLRDEVEIASQTQGNDPGQTWPGAEFRNEKGQYTTDDGYVFNPEDVTEDLGEMYLVPVNGTEHVIPKDRLTNFEIAAVEKALSGTKEE